MVQQFSKKKSWNIETGVLSDLNGKLLEKNLGIKDCAIDSRNLHGQYTLTAESRTSARAGRSRWEPSTIKATSRKDNRVFDSVQQKKSRIFHHKLMRYPLDLPPKLQ